MQKARKRVVGRKPWTVMVFMTVDDANLDRIADSDLREMEKVGSTPHLNVVVQIDRRARGPKRYLIEPGRRKTFPVPPNEENQGDPAVLANFVDWAKSSFPADRYLLVLYGHAHSLGFGTLDGDDALTIHELATVLKGCGRVDILGANACALSYAEAAYQLRDAADFMVASEAGMPFAGWPYQSILGEIDEKKGIAPVELGKLIVRHFIDSFQVGRDDVELTLLGLRGRPQVLQLGARIRALAEALLIALEDVDEREHIRTCFDRAARAGVPPLLDLFDLCLKLQTCGDAEVTKAANAVRKLLDPDKKQLIVTQENLNGSGLHGLGIFVPRVNEQIDAPTLGQYLALDLVKETRWAELVFKLAPGNKSTNSNTAQNAAVSILDARKVLTLYNALQTLEKGGASVATAYRDLGGEEPKSSGFFAEEPKSSGFFAEEPKSSGFGREEPKSSGFGASRTMRALTG